MSVLAGFAAGVGTGIVNNLLAGYNADVSYRRQKELMDSQNAMNMANVRSAPGAQVEGLRMAGFNPAMMNGAGTQVAPTVSQGNADMPQTIPFNAQDALAMAQIANLGAQKENIEANTDKTRAETEVIPTEGEKNVAQTLLYGKQAELTEEQKEQVKQESQRIKNINEQYSDQNKGLTMYGRILAEKWQDTEWYKHLSEDTRDTIDSLATGDVNLTVGLMDALERHISAQENLSDADHKLVRNAFDNAVIESQFNDKEVMAALQKEPWYRKEHLRLTNEKIQEDINHIKNEIEKQLAEKPYWKINAKNQSALLGYEAEMKRMLNASFRSGDLDYLKSQGEYFKWLEKYSENMLERIIPAVTTGVSIGVGNSVLNNKGLIPNVKMEKTTKYPEKTSPPLYDAYGNRIPGTGGTKGYTRTERVDTQGKGVENFNF